jgi:hypothetical protein
MAYCGTLVRSVASLLDFDPPHAILNHPVIRAGARACDRLGGLPIVPVDHPQGRRWVINVRLLGGAPAVDVRLRSAPAKLPPWISAVVVLIAAAAVALGLILAAFGLFAALRIAHGYGSSVERASAATSFGPSAWQRQPSGGADRLTAAPMSPPVVARSDLTESEAGPETASIRSEPPAGSAGPGGIAVDGEPSATRPAAESVPADAPPAASGVPAPRTAADDEPIGSVDRSAAVAPAGDNPVASPPQIKRHPAVKRHVVRKRVRRLARRSAYSGAATSPFQPMFSSP